MWYRQWYRQLFPVPCSFVAVCAQALVKNELLLAVKEEPQKSVSKKVGAAIGVVCACVCVYCL